MLTSRGRGDVSSCGRLDEHALSKPGEIPRGKDLQGHKVLLSHCSKEVSKLAELNRDADRFALWSGFLKWSRERPRF